jgi:hypothetical protein
MRSEDNVLSEEYNNQNKNQIALNSNTNAD